jgi:hypothetical protein
MYGNILVCGYPQPNATADDLHHVDLDELWFRLFAVRPYEKERPNHNLLIKLAR